MYITHTNCFRAQAYRVEIVLHSNAPPFSEWLRESSKHILNFFLSGAFSDGYDVRCALCKINNFSRAFYVIFAFRTEKLYRIYGKRVMVSLHNRKSVVEVLYCYA